MMRNHQNPNHQRSRRKRVRASPKWPISMNQPKVSICVPIHDMKDGDKFLWRLVNSLTLQTFKDWELIVTKDGKMAENTNAGIKRARGEYIKILYLDDYFTGKDSLDIMVNGMTSDWLIAGTEDNPNPYWTDDIATGNNKLGSPSALMIKRENVLSGFDERMSWLLDCDYYARLYRMFGPPMILNGNLITLGKHDGQMTHILTDEEKLKEFELMRQKYE